jgi:hypothetical protein
LVLVHERVSPTDSCRGVDHVHHDVDALDRVAHEVVQAHAERRRRLVEPRRIGEHDLHVVHVQDRADVAPCRLRLVGDDRHLLADQGVHER